jgi:hypothetical protein
MSDKGISARAMEDLADIFRIVAAKGEKQMAAGSEWHYLGDIQTVEASAVRVVFTEEGSVSESKLSPSSGLSYEGSMDFHKLHALAEKLRGGPGV